jgi:hypothetical protein
MPSGHSWAALAIAIAAIVVFHWLVPRVILPRVARRPGSRRLSDTRDPKRWVVTAVAGLTTYVVLGFALGLPPLAGLIWGAAFVALMTVLYMRSAL